MKFYKSADDHGVSREDAQYVIDHPVTVLRLREDPQKNLYVGFDSIGRPGEVIVDNPPRENGESVVIHADDLTPSYYELLWR